MTGSSNVSRFESLVNLEGCKTRSEFFFHLVRFESLVNLEGCKTERMLKENGYMFESLVNLEGCKTHGEDAKRFFCLRVLLI